MGMDVHPHPIPIPIEIEYFIKLKENGSWYKFSAATLNILSAKDDIYIEEAALTMCRHSITVLAIQEVRRTTDDRTVEASLKIRKVHSDS